MNFTDRFIASTYGNVMVNDPFTDGSPKLRKSHEPADIRTTLATAYDYYTAIFDGNSNQSNLYLSVDGISSIGVPDTHWPHSKYTLTSPNTTSNFILSGDGFNQNCALIYNNNGNNCSFKSSKLVITDNDAQFNTTHWPYTAALNGDILTFSGNRSNNSVSFDSNIYSRIYNKRESFQLLNITQQKSFSDKGNVEITVNFGNYADPTRTRYALISVNSSSPYNPSGKGVDTFITYPNFNNEFRVSSQFYYNGQLGKYVNTLIIPVTSTSRSIKFRMYKEGGEWKSYQPVHYKTYHDSSLLVVTLVGLVNLKID